MGLLRWFSPFHLICYVVDVIAVVVIAVVVVIVVVVAVAVTVAVVVAVAIAVAAAADDDLSAAGKRPSGFGIGASFTERLRPTLS